MYLFCQMVPGPELCSGRRTVAGSRLQCCRRILEVLGRLLSRPSLSSPPQGFLQLQGFLLDDGILILIQTVLLSLRDSCQSVHDKPHCPSSSVPALYITACPMLHVLPCSAPVRVSRCWRSVPQAVKCLGHWQAGSRTGSLLLAQNHTGN